MGWCSISPIYSPETQYMSGLGNILSLGGEYRGHTASSHSMTFLLHASEFLLLLLLYIYFLISVYSLIQLTFHVYGIITFMWFICKFMQNIYPAWSNIECNNMSYCNILCNYWCLLWLNQQSLLRHELNCKAYLFPFFSIYCRLTWVRVQCTMKWI